MNHQKLGALFIGFLWSIMGFMLYGLLFLLAWGFWVLVEQVGAWAIIALPGLLTAILFGVLGYRLFLRDY